MQGNKKKLSTKTSSRFDFIVISSYIIIICFRELFRINRFNLFLWIIWSFTALELIPINIITFQLLINIASTTHEVLCPEYFRYIR